MIHRRPKISPDSCLPLLDISYRLPVKSNWNEPLLEFEGRLRMFLPLIFPRPYPSSWSKPCLLATPLQCYLLFISIQYFQESLLHFFLTVQKYSIAGSHIESMISLAPLYFQNIDLISTFTSRSLGFKPLPKAMIPRYVTSHDLENRSSQAHPSNWWPK